MHWFTRVVLEVAVVFLLQVEVYAGVMLQLAV